MCRVSTRRVLGWCVAGVVGFVVVRALRESRHAAEPGTPTLRTPERTSPLPTGEEPMPEVENEGDAVELCGFDVTCPNCGDHTRLYRWARGPDDRPPGGPCPRCGWAERHVDAGVRRGIRVPTTNR
jgi:hypothetical protein